MLTLPNDRRGALLPYDYCEIKINNWEFYRENSDGAGWASKLVYLLSELNLEINSIVRIDIALDGEHLLDIYRRRIEKRDIELLGRSKKEQWCNGWGENGLPAVIESEKEETDATKTILHGGRMTGFYVGSGGKSLCGYLKWQRIEADDKFYIAECAKLNGIGEKFELLELRLKNDNIRTIPGFEQPKETMKIWNDTKNKYVRREYRHPLNLDSLLKLQESSFLASVLKSQFENWFEFVPIKGDSKKSRRKTIEFIDWKRLETTELQRLSIVRKPSDVWLSERTSKGLITFAENPAIVECVRRELPKRIAETIDSNELRQLMRSVGFGIADFHHRRDWLEKQDAKIDRRSKEVVKISLKGE
ncbi:MAG: hypothetical protein IPJ74_09390 [Saprospiraceae bacterium]|nr:hypothetical protein [Saprospiraceae bacterium]